MEKDIMNFLHKFHKDMNNKLDTVQVSINNLDKKSDALDVSLNQGFGKVAKNIDALQKDIRSLESATQDDINYLKHKVMELEQEIFRLSPNH